MNNPLRSKRTEWVVTLPGFLWLALFFAVPRGTSVCDGLWVGRGGFRDASAAVEILLKTDGRTGRQKEAPPDWRAVAPEDRLAVVARYWQGLFEE